MSYKKIAKVLFEENYVDDRKIFCYSRRTYNVTKYYVFYISIKEMGNAYFLPRKMILSIKEDILYISYAKITGGFKKHYALIKLDNLILIDKRIYDISFHVYSFLIKNDSKGGKDKFFIIAYKKRKQVNRLVEAIKNYHIKKLNENEFQKFSFKNQDSSS